MLWTLLGLAGVIISVAAAAWMAGHAAGYRVGYRQFFNPTVPTQSVAARSAQLQAYYQKELRRMYVLVTLWQGKHRMLAHENNKLRAKLRRIKLAEED